MSKEVTVTAVLDVKPGKVQKVQSTAEIFVTNTGTDAIKLDERLHGQMPEGNQRE